MLTRTPRDEHSILVLLVGLGDAGAFAADKLGRRDCPGVLFLPFVFLQTPYHVPADGPFRQWRTAVANPPAPDIVIVMGTGDPNEETMVRELSEILKPRGALVVYFLTGPASPQEMVARLMKLKGSSSGADGIFHVVPHEIAGRDGMRLERAAGDLLDALFKTGCVSFDFNDFRCLTRDGCVGIALALEVPADAADPIVGRLMGHPIWRVLPPDRYSRWLVSYTGADQLGVFHSMVDGHLRKSARIKLAAFEAEAGGVRRLALFAGNPW